MPSLCKVRICWLWSLVRYFSFHERKQMFKHVRTVKYHTNLAWNWDNLGESRQNNSSAHLLHKCLVYGLSLKLSLRTFRWVPICRSSTYIFYIKIKCCDGHVKFYLTRVWNLEILHHFHSKKKIPISILCIVVEHEIWFTQTEVFASLKMHQIHVPFFIWSS